jgi:hypothetical protein
MEIYFDFIHASKLFNLDRYTGIRYS